MKVNTVVDLNPEELKFNQKNRLVDPRHVARIKGAIAKRNLLHINPIKINSKKEIIDGQHRVTAAMDLGLLEVPCLVVNAGVDDAPLLNQHGKNWSGLNFAQYYAANGKKDYQQFLKFVDDTHLKPSTALRLVAKGESYHMGNFRAGTFRIGDLSKAYAFVQKLEDFRDYLPMNHTSPVYLNRAFVFALWMFIAKTPSYSHAQMLRGLEAKGLRETADQRNYIEQLTAIYQKG
jgi:hypothetical protein